MKKLTTFLGLTLLSTLIFVSRGQAQPTATVRVVEAFFTEFVTNGAVPSLSTTVTMDLDLNAGTISGRMSGFYNGQGSIGCNGQSDTPLVNTEYSYDFSGTLNQGTGSYEATINPSGIVDVLSGPCDGESFGYSGNGTLSGNINGWTGDVEINTDWTADSAGVSGLWLGRSTTPEGVDLVLAPEEGTIEICRITDPRDAESEQCYSASSDQAISLTLNNEVTVNFPNNSSQRSISVSCSDRVDGLEHILFMNYSNDGSPAASTLINKIAGALLAVALNYCVENGQNIAESDFSGARQVLDQGWLTTVVTSGKLNLDLAVEGFPIQIDTPTTAVNADNRNNFSVLIDPNTPNDVSILSFHGDLLVTPNNAAFPPFPLNEGQQTAVSPTVVDPIVQLKKVFLPLTTR